MAVTVAGSEGGIKRITSDHSKKSFLKNLLEKRVSFQQYRSWFFKNPRLELASLVINNQCNLRCRHCYLQVKELTAETLSLDEWKQLISSIASMDSPPKMISLNGKEIFVARDGPAILRFLREEKDRNHDVFDIGFITNGTLLHRHYDTILDMNPDYMDISLDGTKEEHNALRGMYAFERAWPNIEWAVKNFGSRFFISLTIQKLNVHRLLPILQFLTSHGIQNICMGFYKPLEYTDQSLILSEDDVLQVFRVFDQIDAFDAATPVDVMLDIDLSYLTGMLAFIKSRWFAASDVQEDIQGQFFILKHIRNNISVSFRITVSPASISRVRLTPEGNLLASGDTQDTSLYRTYSIGNIRDYHFNFPKLYEDLLCSKRLQQIVHEYYHDTLPQLWQAIGQKELTDEISLKQPVVQPSEKELFVNAHNPSYAL